MPISLALRSRHASPQDVDSAWHETLAILNAADAVFSTYREDSVISRLARGEVLKKDCPPEVLEVLELGELARRLSDGAFDVRRPGRYGDHTLDPSGVVKGWALAGAARAIHRLPDTDFCLAAGGDMVCHTRTTAAAWRIGIEDPLDPTRVLAVVPVRNGGVATSGLTHRGDHIVDARTGATPGALASVTVIGPDLVWADIHATAAFALGQGARHYLAERGVDSGVLVWRDGTREVLGPVRSPGTAA
ncbi:MAG: FAD:protein FMN transferase [Marmoricola sp.]